MSSSTGAKHVDDIADTRDGLSIDVFLSTLEWVKDSHPIEAQGSDASPSKCIACMPPGTGTASSSGNTVAPIDHLEGTARLRVGKEHYMAFSSFQAGGPPTRSVTAVLSINEGFLRLALRTKEEGAIRCVTLNAQQILKEPKLCRNEKGFALEISFPFITLVFEKHGSIRPLQAEEGTVSALDSYEVRLRAIQEAIMELADMMPTSEAIAQGKFISCFEEQLGGKRRKWATERFPDVDQTFREFMSSATAMVMPPAFPYRAQRTASIAGQGSVNEQNHLEFVDCFVDVEAVRDGVMQQAEAWLQYATRTTKRNGDRMLKEADFERRKGTRETAGYMHRIEPG